MRIGGERQRRGDLRGKKEGREVKDDKGGKWRGKEKEVERK